MPSSPDYPLVPRGRYEDLDDDDDDGTRDPLGPAAAAAECLVELYADREVRAYRPRRLPRSSLPPPALLLAPVACLSPRTCPYARLHVPMRGCMSPCVAACPYAWLHVPMHGCMSLCVAACPYAWLHVPMRGCMSLRVWLLAPFTPALPVHRIA